MNLILLHLCCQLGPGRRLKMEALENPRKHETCPKLFLAELIGLGVCVRIAYCSCGLACEENHWLGQVFI